MESDLANIRLRRRNLEKTVDREGWVEFLHLAQNIFEEYGDIPFGSLASL